MKEARELLKMAKSLVAVKYYDDKGNRRRKNWKEEDAALKAYKYLPRLQKKLQSLNNIGQYKFIPPKVGAYGGRIGTTHNALGRLDLGNGLFLNLGVDMKKHAKAADMVPEIPHRWFNWFQKQIWVLGPQSGGSIDVGNHNFELVYNTGRDISNFKKTNLNLIKKLQNQIDSHVQEPEPEPEAFTGNIDDIWSVSNSPYVGEVNTDYNVLEVLVDFDTDFNADWLKADPKLKDLVKQRILKYLLNELAQVNRKLKRYKGVRMPSAPTISDLEDFRDNRGFRFQTFYSLETESQAEKAMNNAFEPLGWEVWR